MKRIYLNDLIETGKIKFNVSKAILTIGYEEHKHDFSEIVIITDGRGVHVIDGNEHNTCKGDVFVLRGDISHSFKDVDNLTMYNVKFDAASLIQNTDELKKIAGFQVLFALPTSGVESPAFWYIKPSSICFKTICGVAFELAHENRKKDEGYELLAQNYFIALVIYLSREYLNNKDKNIKIYSFANALAYIESNYYQDIALSDLAAMAGLSVRQFLRVFNNGFKSTPIQYIINLRLKNACRLLYRTDLEITFVAEECGFDDSNYFSRLFKKHLGETPSEYRMRLQGKVQ